MDCFKGQSFLVKSQVCPINQNSQSEAWRVSTPPIKVDGSGLDKRSDLIQGSSTCLTLTSTFSAAHPFKNSLMLPMQSASVLGSKQYCKNQKPAMNILTAPVSIACSVLNKPG